MKKHLQDFKILYLKNEEQEIYKTFWQDKMNISQAINRCKRTFNSFDFYGVALSYSWGDSENIIFKIDQNNLNGVLEFEAKLMIKEEFNIN